MWKTGRQPGTVASAEQLQGKALSYNNVADADAALYCVKVFDEPACVIVKHANPCGVAEAHEYRRGVRPGVRDRSDVRLRRHPCVQQDARRSNSGNDSRPAVR